MNLNTNILISEQILIKTAKGIRLNPHWELYARCANTTYNGVVDQYGWCSDGMREIAYCIINDLTEPPGCIKCGGFVTFNIHRNKYNSYCSKQCTHSKLGGGPSQTAATTLSLPNVAVSSPLKNASVS